MTEEIQRPRLAVFKFASCDGCQLSVLSMEEDLLTLAERVEIAYFPEATGRMQEGPYDIALIEGSVSLPEQLHHLAAIREQCRTLITIGACATSGGLQALRNFADHDAFVQAVYPNPEHIRSLSTSTPISEHVTVDYELWGCPIDKGQLRNVLSDLLAGVEPRIPGVSVCQECKRRQQVCVLVARGEPCLGPVTRTGCGAICPAMGRACYGCFGPSEPAYPPRREHANTDALSRRFREELHLSEHETAQRFRFIHSYISPFKEAGEEET